MAGAGYKLFNTGDVLTAAQVNTYLMEQTVMVFADAAARTTALTGVVSEGMISYLKDTNAVEVYNGSAWVASDDPNAIQNTIVDAKGDLITATASDVPARLAVGNNGETLVADSSATTGLRWQGNYAAGKNKFINGDCAINQRSFSSTTSGGVYMFDRWISNVAGDGTATFSAQTFTAGTAPVAGYESINFLRIVTASQTTTAVRTFFSQRIEDVRAFAGQTITVSFWAKAGSGTPSVACDVVQFFGSGGSADVAVAGQKTAITTSWARYSFTFSVPSISGKTLGAGNYLNVRFWTSAGSNFNSETNSLGIQSATIEFWGLQVEAGNVATAFQTATGTLAGELAAAMRYYQRYNIDSDGFAGFAGTAYSTTAAAVSRSALVPFRVTPTAIDYSGVQLYDNVNAGYAITGLTIWNAAESHAPALLATGATGLTQFRYYNITSTGGSGYIGLSAEL